MGVKTLHQINATALNESIPEGIALVPLIDLGIKWTYAPKGNAEWGLRDESRYHMGPGRGHRGFGPLSFPSLAGVCRFQGEGGHP